MRHDSGSAGGGGFKAARHPDALSPLERQIVAMAKRDRPRSLDAPSPFARRLGRLFGVRRQNALAHPRLEALRRFAILAWHRPDAITRDEVDALLSAGFGKRQMLAVLAYIRPETVAALAARHEGSVRSGARERRTMADRGLRAAA